jgi:hypothetical protein
MRSILQVVHEEEIGGSPVSLRRLAQNYGVTSLTAMIAVHDRTGRHLPVITLRAVQDNGRFIEVTGNFFTHNGTVKLAYDITSGGGPTTHQTGEDTLVSDGIGRFVHRIRVTLAGDISGAHVNALDVALNRYTPAQIP